MTKHGAQAYNKWSCLLRAPIFSTHGLMHFILLSFLCRAHAKTLVTFELPVSIPPPPSPSPLPYFLFYFSVKGPRLRHGVRHSTRIRPVHRLVAPVFLFSVWREYPRQLRTVRAYGAVHERRPEQARFPPM